MQPCFHAFRNSSGSLAMFTAIRPLTGCTPGARLQLILSMAELILWKQITAELAGVVFGGRGYLRQHF